MQRIVNQKERTGAHRRPKRRQQIPVWDWVFVGQVMLVVAILIPLDELAARTTELPKDKEITVVCLSGKRSQEGMQILLQAGYKQVNCLSSGLNGWREAGYPLEP